MPDDQPITIPPAIPWPEQPIPPPEAAAEEAPAPEARPYIVTTWRGHPRWACAVGRCRFDTLAGEATMEAHLRDMHTPNRRLFAAGLVDQYGQPLEITEGS